MGIRLFGFEDSQNLLISQRKHYEMDYFNLISGVGNQIEKRVNVY